MPVVFQRSAAAEAAGFRIRDARRGDVDALANLMAELGYPDAPDSATVHWVLSHPEIKVIVATDTGDRVIGFISLSHRPQLRMKGRFASMDELVVTAKWRRKGVGRDLVKRAIDHCKVLMVKRVELITHNIRGHEAKAFYESCGFFEVDRAVMRFAALDAQPQ